MKPLLKLITIAASGALFASVGFAQEEFPYRDERTDAVSVVHSYYNAINRHEYARAWAYWHEGGAGPSYEEFVEGFADTAFVELATGNQEEEGAAGSTYFAVPVAIEASSMLGVATTYSGCFFLKLVQPALQEPPFAPLHIESAKLTRVAGLYTDVVPEVCAP